MYDKHCVPISSHQSILFAAWARTLSRSSLSGVKGNLVAAPSSSSAQVSRLPSAGMSVSSAVCVVPPPVAREFGVRPAPKPPPESAEEEERANANRTRRQEEADKPAALRTRWKTRYPCWKQLARAGAGRSSVSFAGGFLRLRLLSGAGLRENTSKGDRSPSIEAPSHDNAHMDR